MSTEPSQPDRAAHNEVHAHPIIGRLLALLPANSLLRDPRLAALLAGILLVYLGLGIIIPVRALFAREAGLSLLGIGAMASSFLLFNTLGQVPFGWLTDRIGRKPLIVAGIGVEVVIAILYVLVSEPWTFIALRAAEGAAAAAITPAARAYVTDVSPAERRSEAFGLLGATLSGGILVGPAIGGWLTAAAGFQAAFIASAVGRLLALALVVVLVREPVSRAVRAAMKPGRWRSALSPVLVGGYTVAFGLGFANGLFFALWSLFLADHGASLWQIGLSYSAFGLPLLLLTPMAGRLGDRHGRLRFLLVPGLIEASFYLAFAASNNVWLIVILCIMQGTMYAFMVPSLDGIVADASPAEGRGRVQGLYSAINLAGSFLSAILCTVLYGWHTSAPFVLITGVVVMTVTVGCVLLWRAGRRPNTVEAVA